MWAIDFYVRRGRKGFLFNYISVKIKFPHSQISSGTLKITEASIFEFGISEPAVIF